MTPLVALDDRTLVAGQIGPEEVTQAAAAGVSLIVNNRPDGEEPGQPASAEIERAAADAGLDYRHIPVAGAIAADQVGALCDAMESATGRVLLVCRSGTRSTFLWAMAACRNGADGESVIAKAAVAGFDVSALGPFLGGSQVSGSGPGS